MPVVYNFDVNAIIYRQLQMDIKDTNDARKCHDCDYKNYTANFYELSVNIRPDQDINFAQIGTL